ncbi:hemagglutinin repeat-containing protein [Vibrio sp. VB16]|uniref:hemagglutinin repeat-containing protein n=1 Tax=Vibrio sp. VB16 TaxID=2785746 RepID=UPI00189E105D|nr:hemagglutinin repeat-containing protein [Vibrio sp. VB16]UGA56715.1 hemagglutinin repeat-containing protein [Vibrio sp. VB16]
MQSTGTYGFNAGIQLDVEVSKTGTTDQQTSSLASTLSGENIRIQAGNQEGDQAKIQGATLLANDALSIAANEVNLLASTDTQSQKSKNESGAISASMTVYGASSGINLNASLSRNESKSASTTHQNSTLSAENISITSAQDTNIKGANVDAKEHLNVAVGGDLNIASVQDRHSASNKGMGISAGLSFSGGEVPKDSEGDAGGLINNLDGQAGNLTGASGGTNVSNGRSRSKQTILTTLTSGNTATITVANNTDVKGALIATVDEEGKDLGNLNLKTDTFTYADLSNTQYNQSQNMGISTSVGLNGGEIDATNNSTNLQYKNESGYSKSKTLATVGQGTVTIMDSENSHDTTALNRDTLNTEKDLFTVDRKQGDIDVTLDHRLLTEEGRKDIKEDIKRTELAGKSLADVVTDESVEVSDTFEHMDVLQKELDIQKKIAQENPEAAQILNNLDLANAEAKQYATEVYLQTYADVMGITIDEARVVAFKGGAKGNHLVQNGKTTVELNDAETTNGADAVNTIIHEGTHASINQGRIGDKGEYEEQYTGLIGNYAEDTFQFVLDNYGLGEYKSGDVNKHIGNDSSQLIRSNNIESDIQHNTQGVSVDNRFLSKREYELANSLAAKSNGQYSAEEIRNVMRHSKAQENEKYDAGVSPYVVDTSKVNDKSFVDSSDGKLIVGQDGTGKGRYIVQDMESIPLDESAKQYLQDQELGYNFFKAPETKTVEIDFLTGKPINSQKGTYQVSHTIDGKSYTVDYHSCATVGCLATNSNMVNNTASEAFIDATSAKALDDASDLATKASLVTPAGPLMYTAQGISTAASYSSAGIKGELTKQIAEEGTTALFGLIIKDLVVPGKAEKVEALLDNLDVSKKINETIPEDKEIKTAINEYLVDDQNK